VNRHLPTRTLTDRPHLDQLKRQAKELLDGFGHGVPEAIAEVRAHYRDADPATFALHDAQLVLARAYGFESWPKLKAFVDGANVARLVDAVKAGDLESARSLLELRPELAGMSQSNFGMLHFAVLQNAPEMVRLLMRHGANARHGVYPHRDATTAHEIAVHRGYTEIVRIIEEDEQKRPSGTTGRGPDPSPLHRAAHAHDLALVERLLGEGQDPNTRALENLTPLDVAAERWWQVDTPIFERIARLLLARGARVTPKAAAALGDARALRGWHAEGRLPDARANLLRIAVTHNRSEILALLLDLGFDPDERQRLSEDDSAPFTWGMPLQHAVQLGRYEMAEELLQRGADPNAEIYASGDPMFSAYDKGDLRMIALLERYGGRPAATTAGLFRQTELAKRMLSGEAPYRVDGATGAPLAEQLLWGAACGGDAEIVRLALERIDWPRDDPRWFDILEQTVRHWGRSQPDDFLSCFTQVIDRCDPNLRGRPTDNQQFGLTPLHNIVARGNMPSEARVPFAAAILDRGARLDLRDHLLKSTPLGWACRWGQAPLVRLFLERGADPVEPDAEPWATPRAWARRMKQREILELLDAADSAPR
jgi:ankyrin repeat protein